MRVATSSLTSAKIGTGEPFTPHRQWQGSSEWTVRWLAVAGGLIMGDGLVAGLAALLAVNLGPATSWDAATCAVATLAILVPLHASLGLYASWGPCPIERLRLRTLTALLISFMAGIVLAAASEPHLGGVAIIGATLLIVGYYMEALVRHLLIKARLWGAPTVLIGSPATCSRLARRLLRDPALGLVPIGFVSDQRESAAAEEGMVPLLCGIAEAARLSGMADVAIVAASDLVAAEGRAAISLAGLPFRHVIVTETAGELPNLGLRTRNLGNALGLEIRSTLFQSSHVAVKRLIDLAISVPVLVAVAPLIALLALAIKLADPGPAFYCQLRVGRNGQVFGVFKLRTMYRNAEDRLHLHLNADPEARAEWERFFKLKNDPRILPVIGNFLRRSSLDEFPQLLNILRGEMSLVGPRPFPGYHMNSFDPAFQSLRVSVTPGLTGLWQVSSRSGGDLEVQKEQDLFYIRNWSLWLDIYILLETFPAVVSARGAR